MQNFGAYYTVTSSVLQVTIRRTVNLDVMWTTFYEGGRRVFTFSYSIQTRSRSALHLRALNQNFVKTYGSSRVCSKFNKLFPLNSAYLKGVLIAVELVCLFFLLQSRYEMSLRAPSLKLFLFTLTYSRYSGASKSIISPAGSCFTGSNL